MGVVPNIQSRLYSIASASEMDRVCTHDHLCHLTQNCIGHTKLGIPRTIGLTTIVKSTIGYTMII